jgi:branched-chain amino acid transport system ATP-binding protein
MSDLLTLEGVHTHIGRYHILQGVDLVVPRGGFTVLLGRNGAGKTTTLRTIMGLWRASQGRIRFGSEDFTARPTPDIASAGIAYVPENMGIFTGLTVRENFVLAARSGRIEPKRSNGFSRCSRRLSVSTGSPPARCRAGRSRCFRSHAR